jgi:tetratricopeptide (TPR) repeat protein
LLSLEEAIKIYPDFAVAYNQKGNILLLQNKYEAGLEAFSNAIRINPEYLEAKLNFGIALFHLKDFKKSSQVFTDVLQVKSDYPLANMYLGISLIGLKDIAEAEVQLKKAISSGGKQNVALAHRYLGGIYLERHQEKDALDELQKYLELFPKATDAAKIKSIVDDLKKKTKGK